jgi:hypothetical protein
VPAVFAGERLLVYGRVRGSGGEEVTLRGQGPKGEVSYTVRAERVRSAGRPVIAALWARAALRDLEEGRSALHDRRGSLQERGREDRVKGEIVRIATAYGLASRETSFVAVEERAAPSAGQAVLRRVPIVLTTGWGGLDRARAGHAAAAPPGLAAPSMPMGAPAKLRAAALHSLPSRAMDLCQAFEADESAEPEPGHAASRPLDRLVDLQRADGSWELTDELAAAVGTSRLAIEKAAEAAGCTAADARRCWATAVALAWLEQRAAEWEGEWALLAAKAREWLRRQAGTDAEALVRRAREVVRGAA